MSLLKKEIKTKLFDKLKSQGCAFNHIRYTKERKFKIHSFLEEGYLGSTFTPILKDKKFLTLELYYEKLLIYESNPDTSQEKILLKEIINWQEKTNFACFSISNIYENYFYEIDDINKIFSHRTDKKDLNILLNTIYPELKVRHYEENSSNGTICLWLGSSTFSFKVRKSLEYKKLTIESYFYGSGSDKYQSGNKYNLAKKYQNIIKQNLDTQYIYDLDLTKYKNLYLKASRI